MLLRYLRMKLPPGQSAFLWGARQTGKSTFLKQQYPHAVYYDLLQTDLFMAWLKNPALLREEVLALSAQTLQSAPIIIDEVQKIPMILNEIHWLIENAKTQFILCGSSARKLKRGAANLLGGRAWRYTFYPLVFAEIPNFDLLHALNNGLIPSHYQKKSAAREIDAYLKDY